MKKLNRVTISGTAGDIVLSHENNGKYYYKMMVTVADHNGSAELFPIIVEDSILGSEEYTGKEVCISGQMRSVNTAQKKEKPHNEPFISADVVKILEEPVLNGDINEIVFIGKNYTKSPVLKTTSTHRKVTNLFMAIPRSATRNDYISCSFWGKEAVFAASVKRNDFIKIKGRIINRIIYAGDKIETRYEIFVTESEKVKENEEPE